VCVLHNNVPNLVKPVLGLSEFSHINYADASDVDIRKNVESQQEGQKASKQVLSVFGEKISIT